MAHHRAGEELSEGTAASAQLAAGSLIAGYRIVDRLGAGGTAVVYRARDERLGRGVALKVMAPRWAADAGFRQRFIAEARAATTVDHPNIIPVYEAGDADGVLFIAMRLVTGGDLRAVLLREGQEQGALPPARALDLLLPVASALDAAHAAGLVHRDIKPANILVQARPADPDQVYVSDFGLSKGALPGPSLTQSGQYLGTPHYSAPEQAQGQHVDGRADQYALACVAFELLCGARPFERDQPLMVLLAHVYAPPPALTGRRPDLPAAVDPVMARALAKAPGDRYPSCQDFTGALRHALGLPPHGTGAGTAAMARAPEAASREPRRKRGITPARAATITVAAATAATLAIGLAVAPLGGRSPGIPAGHGSAASAIATVLPGHGALLDTLTVSGSDNVSSLAFAPGSTTLAAADDLPSGSIHLWDTADKTLITTLTDPRSHGVHSIAFASDGTTLASAGNDGSVDVWDTAHGSVTVRLTDPRGKGATSVAFAPGSSTTLAVGDNDGTTYLWNITTRRVTSRYTDPYTGGVTVVTFSPDGTLATGDANGEANVWGTSPTAPAGTAYNEPSGPVTSLGWENTTILAVGAANGHVYIFDAQTDMTIGDYAIPGGAFPNSVAWTPAGGHSMLAIGADDGTTYLSDTANSVPAARDSSPGGESVTSVAFAPDGTIMVTGGISGTISLWRVTPGRPLPSHGIASLLCRWRGASDRAWRGQRDRDEVLGDVAGQRCSGRAGVRHRADTGDPGDRALVPVAGEFDVSRCPREPFTGFGDQGVAGDLVARPRQRRHVEARCLGRGDRGQLDDDRLAAHAVEHHVGLRRNREAADRRVHADRIGRPGRGRRRARSGRSRRGRAAARGR
jgi:serine/threonine-protein kinase